MMASTNSHQNWCRRHSVVHKYSQWTGRYSSFFTNMFILQCTLCTFVSAAVCIPYLANFTFYNRLNQKIPCTSFCKLSLILLRNSIMYEYPQINIASLHLFYSRTIDHTKKRIMNNNGSGIVSIQLLIMKQCTNVDNVNDANNTPPSSRTGYQRHTGNRQYTMFCFDILVN